jgi:RNA polymerase sigma-70 factor (ECF subfamily)
MDEFETLLTASRIAVDRWLKAHICNRADAEDVLQETCLAAFQGFPRLQNKASFLPWILGIARRKCADWYRVQAKDKAVLRDHLPDQAEFASDDSAVNETLDIARLENGHISPSVDTINKLLALLGKRLAVIDADQG